MQRNKKKVQFFFALSYYLLLVSGYFRRINQCLCSTLHLNCEIFLASFHAINVHNIVYGYFQCSHQYAYMYILVVFDHIPRAHDRLVILMETAMIFI